MFLCLPSAVWPFPLAKPLAFRGTANKGCVSLVSIATKAPALFIERETEVHYFPQPSTWAWTLRMSKICGENCHDLTPRRKLTRLCPAWTANSFWVQREFEGGSKSTQRPFKSNRLLMCLLRFVRFRVSVFSCGQGSA